MIRIASWPRFIVFVIVVAALIGAVGGWFILGQAKAQQTGTITIAEGTATVNVWRQLVDEGYTKTTWPWRLHAWRQSDPVVKAGTYYIEYGESVDEILHRLAEGLGNPDELTLTFPEGFTVAQMAARVASRGIGDEAAFLSAAKPTRFVDQFDFLAEVPAGRNLEGYLFPDTYRVFKDDQPEDVIQRMVATFDAKVTDDIRAGAAAQGRSLDEIVIMASIIEREVLTDADMATVSGILWKRFDDGVGLGADATVRYALEKWDEPLTVQDLAINSPYNTRKYRGLPPGPISNPGLRALQAAAFPEQSDYYYYLSTPEGETIFSKTNDEHNLNKAKYLR